MIVLLIVLVVLALTGWAAFFCAQDQVHELMVERDRYRNRWLASVIDRSTAA